MNKDDQPTNVGEILAKQAAQAATDYDADRTDTKYYKWMKGFPPEPIDVVSAIDGSFAQFPAFRYSICNIREFVPTKRVKCATTHRHHFEEDFDEGIEQLTLRELFTKEELTWDDFLKRNFTDGILILNKGKIVYEKYLSALDREGIHGVMSVSKSLLGTLAAMLVNEGHLNENETVGNYVSEMRNSGFADATVRQLLDMTTAVDYNEDYSDPNADIWAFSAAGDPFQMLRDFEGPRSYYEYLQTVPSSGIHGKKFSYKTINTDVLAWVISRGTGKSLPQLLSEKLWIPLGTNFDGYYQIDSVGIPFAGGGFNANLQDLARFGEMMRNDGFFNGKQIVPRAVVEDIKKGGSKSAFLHADYKTLPNGSYRSMWWHTHNTHGAFTARGVFGQAIYIDPKAEMVIVRLASNPVASNQANDPFSLPAYHAVAEYLMKKNP